MTRCIAACVFAMLALPALSQSPEPSYVDDPEQWGKARRVVEPEFPRQALAEGRSGYIDVRGRVSAFGALENIEYSAENRQAGVFIDPVRKVIRNWQFQPPLGRDCQPSEERVVNRVWFEPRGGKPYVSVSLLRPPPVPGGPIRIHPLHREEPAYPQSMLPGGDTVVVYTRVKVGADGTVVSVEPHAHARRRRTNTREFEHEVIRALTQWKYPPAAQGQGTRYVCHDLWFKPG